MSTAVIRPREAEGKYSVAVATKRAVLREIEVEVTEEVEVER